MQIFRGLSPVHARPGPRAVTIGNFDGVHQGHRALIRKTIELAESTGARSVAVTFEPHPKAFFSQQNAPARIQGLRDKAAALAALGLDEFWVLPFRRQLAQMEAEPFIEDFLHHTLHAHDIVVGDDFCFGARRRGNFDMLSEFGRRLGWQLHRIQTVMSGPHRASSSLLRQALQRGDLAAARLIMGRPYTLAGRVGHGQKLGRTIGFPTLNIRVPSDLALLGIFVVSVHGLTERAEPGVASLGKRPTVEDDGRLLLEVHCLDWSGDAYGRPVCVEFHEKLRDEAHYPDMNAMTQQIHHDAQAARDFFTHHAH